MERESTGLPRRRSGASGVSTRSDCRFRRGDAMECPDTRGKRSLLSNIIVFLFLISLPSFLVAGETSTYDTVLAGKRCAPEGTQEVRCTYRVGNDLHFTVDGIGGLWTDITFIKSSYEGDFYATFGLGLGCVVVKRGKSNWENPGCGGPGSAFDYAFISSKTGEVFRDWQDCMKRN